jgi:uncharacterized membrane protein
MTATETWTTDRERAAGRQQGAGVNVSGAERWASVIGGGALAFYGLTRGSLGGVALAAVGSSLVYRGATGHCPAYGAMGVNTAGHSHAALQARHAIKVEESITVNRSAAEVYHFWRRLENLPRFMEHLESVTATDDRRSHWIAKAPLGAKVEWDAEIINDRENELIAWRSLPGSQIPNAGSVRFAPAAGGLGTEVMVELFYDAPGGQIGAAFAKLFGEEPRQQVHDDLQRFKQVMESGEASATAGQASTRSTA